MIKATTKTITKVFQSILDQCNGPNGKVYRKFYTEKINRICDSAGDIFGTEGQNDPRGDQIRSPTKPHGGLWSPQDALSAVESGTVDEDVAILKRAGILQEDGKVSQRYKRWGKNESRASVAETTAGQARIKE